MRRLVFSDSFYVLYGGVGWGGMGSGGQERVEETRWVNKPHPRLADPDDRRGDQLRRGQVRARAQTREENAETQHTAAPASHERPKKKDSPCGSEHLVFSGNVSRAFVRSPV